MFFPIWRWPGPFKNKTQYADSRLELHPTVKHYERCWALCTPFPTKCFSVQYSRPPFSSKGTQCKAAFFMYGQVHANIAYKRLGQILPRTQFSSTLKISGGWNLLHKKLEIAVMTNEFLVCSFSFSIGTMCLWTIPKSLQAGGLSAVYGTLLH